MQGDKSFMGRALSLARKGLGRTSPNPMVGAVVVKGGRIVGTGYHKKAGIEHAEVSALRDSGRGSYGATLYVNMEPCNHFGRTPPCTELIIKRGIKRVVAGMKDPNPINNGKGLKRLKAAGISVTTGVLEERAKALNEFFIKYITTGRPFVIAKAAQSIDGKIATATGDSKWISCEDARRFVHRLRSQVDAVMVGAGTVLRDDPLLTSRKEVGSWRLEVGSKKKDKKQPIKIIVDSRLRIPIKSKIFSKNSPAEVIIATSKRAAKSKIKKFAKLNCEVLVIKEKKGKLDLRQLMKELGKREITSVLVEGGGKLIGGLVDESLVDKFLFFIAPKIIGGRNAITSVEGEGIKKVSQSKVLKNLKYRKFGNDLLIEAYTHW